MENTLSRMAEFAAMEQLPQAPCYIFDIPTLTRGIGRMRRTLKHCSALCFAMKANPFLVTALAPLVDRFEVCSPGEYEICAARGIDPEKIIVSGVNKTEASMRRILSLSGGKGIYTVESPLHYEILSRQARELGLHLSMMIRLSSGNQFGVDRESLEAIAEKLVQDPNCTLMGIHFFSGTQKKMKKIARELEMLEEYGAVLKEKLGLTRLELEYGPGLAVGYFERSKAAPPQEQLEQLEQLLAEIHSFDAVGIEMGRFIASECGLFLTRIMDLKQTEGTRYAIADSGIHQLHYFGQMMGMEKPPICQIPCREQEDPLEYVLCGSLCTVNDVMVRDVALHPLQLGDHLLFGRCGAYSMTEGSALFLSREFPAVYEYGENGRFRCLRPLSETYLMNTENI